MKILIDERDFSRLHHTSRQDIIETLLHSANEPPQNPENVDGFDWEDVVDLTPAQAHEFMQGCQEKTISGLKIMAKHGPIIPANFLQEAGIENYGHFQGTVTKRTRTITGNKHAFLFTWDDWYSTENAERGYGNYAVTNRTFESLRKYFQLD